MTSIRSLLLCRDSIGICNHLIADENGRVCEPVEINGITDSGLHFESDSCSVRAAARYTEAAPARSMRQ